MTAEHFMKLKTGDYQAICQFKGNCIIYVNKIPNKLGVCSIAAECSIDTCCRDCYAAEGNKFYFTIK